jgi:peptidoglycan/LPS O-acetylase OafA/YrhL
MSSVIQLKQNIKLEQFQDKEKSLGSLVSTEQIKALTGLRIVPASFLILLHLKEHYPSLSRVGESFVFGHAVTFFFVLSGFILTYNYFKLNDRKSIFLFYVARFARMWPAHFISLILLIFLVPEVFKLKAALLPAFFCNIFLVHSWIPDWKTFFSFNSPSWTNSTEVFFYLCFPFLLIGLRKRWYFSILVAISSLLATIALCNGLHLPESSHISWSMHGLVVIHPLSRLFEFSVGMTTALFFGYWLRRINLSFMSATILEVLACAGIFFASANATEWRTVLAPFISEPGGLWLQNCGANCLIIASLIAIVACQRGLLSKLFATPVMVLLGELSFALYMLHVVFITYQSVNFPHVQTVKSLMSFLLILLVSSHLMWLVAEKPLRKLILKYGSKLAPNNDASENEPEAIRKMRSNVDNKSINKKKIIFVLIEACLLWGIIYYSLPAINKISIKKATSLANTASIQNVLFMPYLKCCSVSANLSADKNSVVVQAVWEALQAENVDFFITMQIVNNANQVINQIAYKQDGRHQHVNKGETWLDSIEISLPVNTKADMSAVNIIVMKRKKQLLLPEFNSQTLNSGALSSGVKLKATQVSMLVPIKSQLQ